MDNPETEAIQGAIQKTKTNKIKTKKEKCQKQSKKPTRHTKIKYTSNTDPTKKKKKQQQKIKNKKRE